MIYDYIIIGSGFGSSVAGLRLSEKGYKVLILEMGKRYNPADFPKSDISRQLNLKEKEWKKKKST